MELKEENMKTQNASIYHCIACGHVVRAQLEVAPPQCCGHTMTKAFTERLGDDDFTPEKSRNYSETAAPATEGRKKAK